MNFVRILAWLHYLAARLAWPGIIGLALAIAALGVDVAAIARVQRQNDGLRDEVGRLGKQSAAAARLLTAADARSLERLPGGSDLAPLVAAVHASARQRNIVLEQGEYVWQDGNAGRGTSYRMSFPARGTYPELRGWIADMLARHPQLQLEQFDVRRESIVSHVVDARVRLKLRMEKSA
jgi:hypothetical protein